MNGPINNNKDCVALPVEVWCHILCYVKSIPDVVATKRACKDFYDELRAREFISSIPGIKWNKAVIEYFASRKHFKATKEQILQICEQSEQYPYEKECDQPFDHYKVIMVGPLGSGKSTLAQYFVTLESNFEGHMPADNCQNILNRDLQVVTRLHLHDNLVTNTSKSPQAQFSRTHAVLLCFSIGYRPSFVQLIEEYLPIVRDRRNVFSPCVQYYLVGLKSDLHAKRKVFKSEAECVARELKMKYFEVSSLQAKGIDWMFNELSYDVLDSDCAFQLDLPPTEPQLDVSSPIATVDLAPTVAAEPSRSRWPSCIVQ